MLGTELDDKVQLYLRKVREGGGVVSARIAVAAAWGILLSCNKNMLYENGGHVSLNAHWAYSLLHRMNFVQRKCTTSKSKHTVAHFAQLRKSFLDEVVQIVTMEEVPAELILNWDQTGIHIVPSATWTMDKRGLKRVELAGTNDKHQITAVFCASITGDFLPVQLIYKGKTDRCHPKHHFPSAWNITHSKNHWSTEETMLQYLDAIILPYIRSMRKLINQEDAAGLVIMDNFRGQVTESIAHVLEENNVFTSLLPPNTTDQLQPLDISVNKPAKAFLKQRFQQWYSDQIFQQLNGKHDEEVELEPVSLNLPAMRELGAKWLVEMADYICQNPQFITNGFLRAGISQALDQIEDEADEDEADDVNLDQLEYEDDNLDDNEYDDPEYSG